MSRTEQESLEQALVYLAALSMVPPEDRENHIRLAQQLGQYDDTWQTEVRDRWLLSDPQNRMTRLISSTGMGWEIAPAGLKFLARGGPEK